MSRGYRGTREAINNGNYHLEQRAPTDTLCTLGVDYNFTNPQNKNFGSFVIPYEDSILPIISSSRFHQVISRASLRLREGPGTNYDIIGSLQPGQRVVAKSFNGEWCCIDIEGDGRIDGFAASSYLKELA